MNSHKPNPGLAPLLGIDSASDPDVERLLEGVAFLTGMVRQRLDDEFPEFIQELAQLLYPRLFAAAAVHDLAAISTTCSVASPSAHRGRLRSLLRARGWPTGTLSQYRTRGSVVTAATVLAMGRGQWPRAQYCVEFFFDCRHSRTIGNLTACAFTSGGLADASSLMRLLQLNLREIRIAAPGQR